MKGFAGRVGIESQSAEQGRAVLELEVGDEHLNQAGTVHGGVLATLVDTAMAMAARTTADESEVPATSQLSLAYLAPGGPGPMVVRAQVRTRGEHLLVCDADVEQDGRTLVHAVASFAVLQH
jgi:uncharacterized protein (TIGR00369 family)